MRAAGENPGLHRRPIRSRSDDRPPIDVSRNAREQTTTLGIGANDPRERGAAAERRDVAGRVARTAGNDLGRVVLEDEHRRFARHPRHLAVDELVGDEIADDEHAAAAERVDEVEQARREFGVTSWRMRRTINQHARH